MQQHRLCTTCFSLAQATMVMFSLIGPAAAADEADSDVDEMDENIFTVGPGQMQTAGNWFATIAIGVQQWAALGDLEIEGLDGDFEDSGFNLSASIHRRWRKLGPGQLSFGLDGGLMGHESDLRVPGDFGDLTSNILFVTPSLKWSFGKPESKRLNLEAGLGVYFADIKEYISGPYGGYEGEQHWKDTAPGGFVGISTDLPISKGKNGLWALNFGARVHYAAFGDVDVFGQNLGSLSGPIATLQVGATYDWFAGNR